MGPKDLVVQPLALPLATVVGRRLLSSRESRGIDDLRSSILVINRPVRRVVSIRVAELSEPRDVALVDIRNLLGREGSRVAGDATHVGIRSVEQGVRRFTLVQGRSDDKVRRPCV
jgi:hypothetical protein